MRHPHARHSRSGSFPGARGTAPCGTAGSKSCWRTTNALVEKDEDAMPTKTKASTTDDASSPSTKRKNEAPPGTLAASRGEQERTLCAPRVYVCTFERESGSTERGLLSHSRFVFPSRKCEFFFFFFSNSRLSLACSALTLTATTPTTAPSPWLSLSGFFPS